MRILGDFPTLPTITTPPPSLAIAPRAIALAVRASANRFIRAMRGKTAVYKRFEASFTAIVLLASLVPVALDLGGFAMRAVRHHA
jgi:hypothetical protein